MDELGKFSCRERNIKAARARARGISVNIYENSGIPRRPTTVIREFKSVAFPGRISYPGKTGSSARLEIQKKAPVHQGREGSDRSGVMSLIAVRITGHLEAVRLSPLSGGAWTVPWVSSVYSTLSGRQD